MEDFFILGFIILVIIAWIINSNNEEKMNSMLDVHEAPTTSSLNSSISIANEDFRNFEDMQAATKIAESAYEKEVAKLENEYNELCEKSEAHLNSSSFISSIERDDSTDDLINKKISLKVFQERNAARSKAMTTISDNHFAEADKNLQIQIDKHQELLDHIGSRATYMNTIIANIISKETIVKADINTPSFNIENTKVDFNTFDKYFGPRNESGIAIDRVNKQIAFLTPNTRAIVRYADIVSSEVIVDSESIIKTDRVSQIGGAVVGGLLTGGIGALVMAMGASKKQLDKINKIELKVLTMGTQNPIHTVLFYHKNSWGVPKSSLEDANKWYDFISVAIKEGQVENQNVVLKNNAVIPTSYLTDELLKLSQLRSNGLLTDDEFTNAKKKLIAM